MSSSPRDFPASQRTQRAWLLRVARPVLTPVVWSTLARWLALVLDCALFGYGMWVVATTAEHHADAPWLAQWPVALGVLVALSLGKASARHLEQWLGHLVAFRALEVVRVELFARLWPQAPAISRARRSADVLETAVRDVDRVEVFFAHTLAPAVTAVLAPLTVLGALAAWGAWPVALVGGLGVALAILVSATLGAGRVSDAGRRQGAVRGQIAQHLTDTSQGLTEVVGYQLESRRRAELLALQAGATEHADRLAVVRGLRRALGVAVQLATVGGGVIVAGRAGLPLTVAAVGCLVVLRCFEAARGVDGFMDNQGETSASVTRLYELAHAVPLVSDPATPQALASDPPDVVWQRVTYTHAEDTRCGERELSERSDSKPSGDAELRDAALVEVTAHAPAGQHTCIVGTSGAGKSTLAQVLLRFADPDAGTVLLGGVPVPELALDDLRREVALVAQHTVLFRASVADNLRLGAPDADDAALWQALDRSGLADDIRELPEGLATRLGERGRTLSGGQAQRLALARALLSGARVLVLDEATAHLDPDLAQRVRASVRDIATASGIIVIEITHRVRDALDADHVVLLDAGRVLDEGSPRDLRDRCAAFGRLLAREPVRGGTRPT